MKKHFVDEGELAPILEELKACTHRYLKSRRCAPTSRAMRKERQMTTELEIRNLSRALLSKYNDLLAWSGHIDEEVRLRVHRALIGAAGLKLTAWDCGKAIKAILDDFERLISGKVKPIMA